VTASSQGVLSFTVTDCIPCTTDEDGDGYIARSCGGPDCDDTRSDVNPAADEVCDDGIDNDCDGLTDGQDSEDCAAPDAPPEGSEGAPEAGDAASEGDGTGEGGAGCGCILAT
jgi:hypothetical protein